MIFNGFYLIKFFIYHALFFFLGPLSIPIIWAIDGLSMVYNLGFLGFN